MSFTIKDSAGQDANVVKDAEGSGRLCVDSSQESKQQIAAVAGKSYASYNDVTFGSGTGGVECGLAYLRNNSETRDLVITKYDIWIGSSTGGSGDALLSTKIGRLSGTLITAGTDATTGNLNLGKLSSVAPVTAKKGDGTALTVTGSVDEGLPYQPTLTRDAFDAVTVLEDGKDIAFTWTPPSGNTSQRVQFIIEFYFRDRSK